MIEDKKNSTLAQQRKGRFIFIMMAIFFMVPVVVVVAMIKFDWKPSGTSYGELMSPPRLIQGATELKAASGQSAQQFWQDKWKMVYIANKCDELCMDKLHDMRQIHVSTYKHILRIERVLITQQKDVSEIQKKYPKLLILNQPTNNIGVLMQQFNINEEVATESNRTYLVDPVGYMMMSYQPSSDPAKIRKELIKLLKYSWAG